MLNLYSNVEKPSKVKLYLVDPTDKLSFQFAALRNELGQNKIPYSQVIGFD